MDINISSQAENWLDQLYNDLSADPYYQKDGSSFLARMEWEIGRYDVEHQKAIITALGNWLLGTDKGKIGTALSMIQRFHGTEHISTLSKMRDNIKNGTSILPTVWLPSIEIALKALL